MHYHISIKALFCTFALAAADKQPSVDAYVETDGCTKILLLPSGRTKIRINELNAIELRALKKHFELDDVRGHLDKPYKGAKEIALRDEDELVTTEYSQSNANIILSKKTQDRIRASSAQSIILVRKKEHNCSIQ